MVLYKETDDNPLFNEFACFVLDRLHTFPNMHDEYAVSPCFDVAEYVSHKTTLHDGTIIYRFSKELMAYLEVKAEPEPTKLEADRVLLVLFHVKFDDCKIDVAAFPINI